MFYSPITLIGRDHCDHDSHVSARDEFLRAKRRAEIAKRIAREGGNALANRRAYR